MNKYLFTFLIIILIILVLVHYIVGADAIKTVFQYPYLKNSQYVNFTPFSIKSSCANTNVTNNNFVFPSTLPISTLTQIQDLSISFSTNIDSPNLQVNISAYTDLEDLFNTSTAPINLGTVAMGRKTNVTNDPAFANTYTSGPAVLTLNALPQNLNHQYYLTYSITNSNSIVINGINLCNTSVRSDNFSLNYLNFLLVNPNPPIKVNAMVGLVFITIFAIISTVFLCIYINNLPVLGIDILKYFLMLGLIVFLFSGAIISLIMIIHGHVGADFESVGVTWILFYYIFNLFAFFKIIY